MDGSPRTLDSALMDEAVMIARRVEAQMQQTERLRQFADRIAEQTQRDQLLLEQLESALGQSVQLSIDELDDRLRGQRLQQVAIQLLQEHRPAGEAVHYKEWFQMLQQAGYRVAGKDPLATFLAQVNRADGVESAGRRSGRYRLAAA